jgi:hypothetical protein
MKRRPKPARRRMASVHLGIRMMNACIDFWDEVAKNPPEP